MPGQELREEREREDGRLRVGCDRHKGGAERGGRGPPGRQPPGEGGTELGVVVLAPRAAPCGYPEVYEHDRAHDVQGQVEPPVGAQQPGQARPGSQRPLTAVLSPAGTDQYA